MRIKILLLTIFFSSVNISCKAQCDNESAIVQFEKDLKIIFNSIGNTNTNLKELPAVIERIESISAIESESDGNYLGKFQPTESDISKWSNWLEKNRKKLCWNDNKKTYSLIK